MAIKNGSVIGIDFGTTNTSIISLMKDDLGEKCVVLGEDGEFPFASLLAISKDNRVFFGNKAPCILVQIAFGYGRINRDKRKALPTKANRRGILQVP